MSRSPVLSVLVLFLGGCGEHWYSYDEAELDVDVAPVLQVDAHVSTPPGAWPQELYGDALRLTFAGEHVAFVGSVEEGEVTASRWEIDDHWGDNVNVLDAWKGCDRAEDCERTFRFELTCLDGEACSGVVSADAFLSIDVRPPQVGGRTGEDLHLSLSVVPGTQSDVAR